VLIPYFMKEIIEQISICARKSKYVDHASGVSARISIANYRLMVASARHRGVRLGEKPAVPRISDLARDYVRRIDFVYTPKHGSWLNVAECELSCMTSQCMKDRRIGDIETLQSEIAAWSARVNKKQRAVDWQFTIDKARTKLKRLYPKI